MKNKIRFSLLALLYIIGVKAQESGVAMQSIMGGQVKVSNLNVARNDDKLFVSMQLDFSALNLKSNHELLLTPTIMADEDTLQLKSILVAGRNRYYLHQRNDGKSVDYALYRAGSTNAVEYQTLVTYQEWMGLAQLSLQEDLCGCHNILLDNSESPLLALDLQPEVYQPMFVYEPPKREAVKLRAVTGQAFIDFPVSKTVIYEDYRNNPRELQKIIATIDVVKNDPDVRITAMSFKGHASPESPYSNNTRLAKGRTEALKKYVQRLYSFSDTLITTSYEPEDWAGLRAYVEQSGLEHKQEILAIIDSSREPDNKEWVLKKSYPEEYRFLLQNCYPALRHSDYRIEYIVRPYNNLEEARRVMKEAPGKLSLQEMYMVANSYEPGSEEYNDVFETMGRLYPNDPVANLNAANAAMGRGDLVGAKKYLTKAGEGGQAYYARGVLAGLEGDYPAAKAYFRKAQELGIAEAEGSLRSIEELEKKTTNLGK
ncbi:MAG: DUF3868 domain-containing protein [Bacteroides sp.]|nr:DUF3868 domain-containing protein [Bacteroides sp.]